ncbi:MAG: DUF1049 domain-containing protein [Nostocaceae cyanobacterium]|nr:DUF1049 domain-containing protein [Nostocaceae cyanobacterium]
MKILASVLTSLIVATWVVVIAIFSVQNYTTVSLKFLFFKSIQIPIGIVLAFSAGAGMIGMTFLQPLWSLTAASGSNYQSEDEAEFFVDEEDF